MADPARHSSFPPLSCPSLCLPQISPIHIVSILEGEEGGMDPEDEQVIRSSHMAVRDKGWVFANSESLPCRVTASEP